MATPGIVYPQLLYLTDYSDHDEYTVFTIWDNPFDALFELAMCIDATLDKKRPGPYDNSRAMRYGIRVDTLNGGYNPDRDEEELAIGMAVRENLWKPMGLVK